MRNLIACILIFISVVSSIEAQVGIGTNSPNSAAILDLHATDKGLLPPRMTIYQRDAIGAPADGLMIFNTTSGCPNYYFSGSWYELCGTQNFVCGTFTVTFSYNGNTLTYGTIESAGGKCWLDRNLGASQVATSSTDAASFGHLFQWGRLDDGHQVRTSTNTTTLSNYDVPEHNMFIIGMGSPFDWRSPQNNNLWQGVNGINNPCPQGYRLPTYAEWDTERTSWSTNNAAGAFASPLKLPVAGSRYYLDGTVNWGGSRGYYWSSTFNGINAGSLFINSSDAGTGYNSRAHGFSVRCIKE